MTGAGRDAAAAASEAAGAGPGAPAAAPAGAAAPAAAAGDAPASAGGACMAGSLMRESSLGVRLPAPQYHMLGKGEVLAPRGPVLVLFFPFAEPWTPIPLGTK